MIQKTYRIIACAFIMMFAHNAYAQKYMHDSAYYKTFLNTITARIYTIKDYADFTFPAINNNSNLKYRANTTVRLGAGVTYDNTSVNLSASTGNSNKDRGKTKSFDIQLHFFPRKWTCDLLYLHYKGFYVDPKGYASEVPNAYYYRPDVKMDLAGFTAYRNLNYKKFSYRTAFNQNEWIQKSAGTVLFGGGIYYQNVHSADSSLIPVKVKSYFSNADFKSFHFISAGPGIGYAHNLVIQKHFYLLGSAIVNGNINFSTDGNGTINNKKTSFEPAFVYKAAAGYGGNVWNVSLSWAGDLLLIRQSNISKTNVFPTGYIWLALARQFRLKKPVPVVHNVLKAVFGDTD